MKPVVDLLFPFPVIRVPPQVGLDLDHLQEICYAVREHDKGGEIRSNCHGWQSGKRIFNNPELSDLADPIQKSISYGLSSIPLIHKTFLVDAAWINISGPGAFNWDHIHPGSAWSGVFYIKAEGDKSGRIWFGQDQQRQLESENYTIEYRKKAFTWPVYGYTPVPGSAILFPSTLIHRVDPNMGESDRISVSFNLTIDHGTATS